MRKKPAFKHEQEVRLVFYDNGLEQLGHSGQSGLLIPVDINVLIEKIIVSPRAADWFVSIVKTVVTRCGYDIEVIPSDGSAPLPR
jgi:hypothetical protein